MIELKSIRLEPLKRNPESARQDEPRMSKPRIILSKCTKNYSCVAFCPRNAIAIDAKGLPSIDFNLCDGCLICLRECPCEAISEEKEHDE